MTDPTSPMYQETVRIPRGDAYTRSFQLGAISGFSWSGVTVALRIREKPSSVLLYDAATDLTSEVTDAGDFSAAFVIPAAVTETLPARCILDCRVSKTTVDFGPYTVFRLHIRIEDSYAAEEEEA